MAAPTPSDFVTTDISTATTSHVVNIPTSAVAGDRVVIGLGYPVTGTTWTPPGAGVIAEDTTEQALGGTNGLYTLVYEVQGAETTVTIGSSQSTKSASVACRVTGDSASDVATITGAAGSNGPPNPPAVTPPSSKDYLFVALGSMGGEVALTAAPTNYSNFAEADTGTAGAVTANSRTAIGTRQLTTGSAEDPDAFTGGDATQEWAASTVLFHPAAAAGPVSGSGAAALMPVEIDAGSGDVLVQSTAGDVDLGAIVAAGTGKVAVSGIGDADLMPVVAAGAGTVPISGSGATVVGPVTAQGSGLVPRTGAGALDLEPLDAAGSGTVPISGSGSADLEPISAQGAGGPTPVLGAGAASLAALDVDGSGTIPIIASGAAVLGPIDADGSGSAPATGSGSAALGAILSSGTGTVGVSGAGAATLPAATLSGAGTVPVVGAGSAVLPAILAQGSSQGLAQGTGFIDLAAIEAQGSGGVAISGSGAAVVGPLDVDGSGSVPLTGSGEIDLTAIEADGQGGVSVNAAGAATLPPLDISGTGEQAITGAGTLTLPALNVQGDDAPMLGTVRMYPMRVRWTMARADGWFTGPVKTRWEAKP